MWRALCVWSSSLIVLLVVGCGGCSCGDGTERWANSGEAQREARIDFEQGYGSVS